MLQKIFCCASPISATFSDDLRRLSAPATAAASVAHGQSTIPRDAWWRTFEEVLTTPDASEDLDICSDYFWKMTAIVWKIKKTSCLKFEDRTYARLILILSGSTTLV